MKLKKNLLILTPIAFLLLFFSFKWRQKSDISLDFWLRKNFQKPYGFVVNTKQNLRSSLSTVKSKFTNKSEKIDVNDDSSFDEQITNEDIKTHWHTINKKTISASNFLSDNSAKESKGIAGGYLVFYDESNIIAANGIGEIFKYNFKKQEFSTINSNLNKIYQNQEFKGKIIKNLYGKFGLKDIYFDRTQKRLLASMTHENKPGSACYGMAILEADLDPKDDIDEVNELSFNIFFKTEQCNSHFNGHATGGRIKRMKDKIIYTVGDLDHNIYGDRKIPQDKNNSIGKIIAIDKNGSFKPLSMGHRNPQGLEIVKDKIFITEHGPTGGDEINLIDPKSELKHYGWPYYVYGFGYPNVDKFRYPHKGIYEKPIFYFSPSIATSEIVFYEKDYFQRWKNKFILASLKTKSIWLLDYDFTTNKIMSKEQIPLDHRIRDIAISSSGEIAITTDDQKILMLTKSNNENFLLPDKIKFQ
tara:strand:+ start:502 stop:1917 length:1416 start_codon:yes stop_codon:yes gene_type:complete